MDRHRQYLRSASCVCSSFETAEYEFIPSFAQRSFMDAADAVAVLGPKRSWSFLTIDFTGHYTASDNTKPISPNISTNNPKEVCKSELVNKTAADATTILINDTSVQDIPRNTSSVEDTVPVENIPAKDGILQDACFKTDFVAVDNISVQDALINGVSSDDHRLKNNSERESAREVKETNSQEESCAAISCSSVSYSSTLLLHKDAKISNCCDSVKPQSSSKYDAIPKCEIMSEYCKQFKKHRRKDRPQRVIRKWKKVPDEMLLNLRTSLFPRTGIILDNSSIDDIEENEIQKELELFQNALQSSEQQADVTEPSSSAICIVLELTSDRKDTETVETQDMCEQLDTDINKNHAEFKSSFPVSEHVDKDSSKHDANKSLLVLNIERHKVKHKLGIDVSRLNDCENFENVTFYENKIPLRYGSDLENLFGLTNKKLRAKKKWKEVKAHIQIKTKHCRSLSNSVHGQTFYVHHRVMKLMTMVLKPRIYVVPLSLKQIDAAKGLAVVNALTSSNVMHRGPRGHTRKSPPANTSQFAMDAFNADGDLAAEVVNIMINLQHRDLLPEDYDLLLRLDDRVKPKTVDVDVLSGLKTEIVVGECDVFDVCAVCLDPYEVGQTKKYLPCQHYFHDACIDSWLSNSSMNCPLDATPVLPS